MERLRFNPPGRRCEVPHCITVLNHLNPGPFCLLHTERATALAFTDPGLGRLWVAIEATRLGLNGSRAATAAID